MKNLSIRWKVLILGIAMPIVLAVILFTAYYYNAKDNALQAFVSKARAICLMTESARNVAEEKWKQGIFSVGVLKAWASVGDKEKILAAVPVVNAWQAAMHKAQEGGYEFRVPKHQPRNPKNEPDELEARALQALKSGQSEYYEIDPEQNAVRYFRPVVLSETCMYCHGDPAKSAEYWGRSDGLDPTGGQMENWKVGSIHGAFEVIQSLDEADAQVAANMTTASGVLVIGLAIYAVFFGLFTTRVLLTPLKKTVAMLTGLGKGDLDSRLKMDQGDEIGLMANELDAFADNLKEEILEAFNRLAKGDFTFQAKGMIRQPLQQANDSLNRIMADIQTTSRNVNGQAITVSQSSQALSDGASNQAASLEEISASLNELTSQVQSNAENASTARQLSSEVQTTADEGNKRMCQMVSAMDEISESATSIHNIIKVIDEIAFQTNLLALNAAVEAARAGQHGKGFAVVAEEVRNLASRSAKAAHETASLIQSSLENTKNGAEIAKLTQEALSEMMTGVGKVSTLIEEIATASTEQAEGISQMNIGVTQIDQVTQSNTATAEESASAAEELATQAERMAEMLKTFKLNIQQTAQSVQPPPAPPQASLPKPDDWGQ